MLFNALNCKKIKPYKDNPNPDKGRADEIPKRLKHLFCLQNFQRRSWSKPGWILPPPAPSRSTRVRVPITARTKPCSTKERCLFCPCGEILEQTSSTPSFGTLRFHLQKTGWPSLVRNLPCSTCITSVPIHWQFSQYCYHRLLMFSLNTQSPHLVCGYYWPSWPFLPLLNKYKYNK